MRQGLQNFKWWNNFNSLLPGHKLEWPILLQLLPYLGKKGLRYSPDCVQVHFINLSQEMFSTETELYIWNNLNYQTSLGVTLLKHKLENVTIGLLSHFSISYLTYHYHQNCHCFIHAKIKRSVILRDFRDYIFSLYFGLSHQRGVHLSVGYPVFDLDTPKFLFLTGWIGCRHLNFGKSSKIGLFGHPIWKFWLRPWFASLSSFVIPLKYLLLMLVLIVPCPGWNSIYISKVAMQ